MRVAAALLLMAVGCTPAPSQAPAATASSAGAPAVAEVRVDPPAPAVDEGEVGPEPGDVGNGWLGVALAVSETRSGGALVTSVVPGSPAASAGVEPNDVIVRIDNEPVANPRDVKHIISSRAAGSRAAVVLKRSGADRLISVLLTKRPDNEGVMKLAYVGQPAPELERLAAVRGNAPETLRALRGRVVVLEFWATWCVACRALMPALNAWHQRYSARGVTVLGVAAEPFDLTSRYANELGMQFAVFADEEGKTSQRYHAFALPTVFVIDQRGIVRDVTVGYHYARVQQLEALVEQLLSEG